MDKHIDGALHGKPNNCLVFHELKQIFLIVFQRDGQERPKLVHRLDKVSVRI